MYAEKKKKRGEYSSRQYQRLVALVVILGLASFATAIGLLFSNRSLQQVVITPERMEIQINVQVVQPDGSPLYVYRISDNTAVLDRNGQRQRGGGGEIKDPELRGKIYTSQGGSYYYDQQDTVCITIEVDAPNYPPYTPHWQVNNALWGAIVNVTVVGADELTSTASVVPSDQQPSFAAIPTIQAGCTF